MILKIRESVPRSAQFHPIVEMTSRYTVEPLASAVRVGDLVEDVFLHFDTEVVSCCDHLGISSWD